MVIVLSMRRSRPPQPPNPPRKKEGRNDTPGSTLLLSHVEPDFTCTIEFSMSLFDLTVIFISNVEFTPIQTTSRLDHHMSLFPNELRLE